MKAFILAAGRGERLRPLTDTLPKPLLEAGGKPLIVWHLERLANSCFKDIVINCAHLGEKIVAALGDGRRFGLSIRYSQEPPGALETAGGIARALPLIGDETFLVVNGDIWCDWDFRRAHALVGRHAHLVLVDNPGEHAGGDFCLDGERLRHAGDAFGPTLTYSELPLAARCDHEDAPAARRSDRPRRRHRGTPRRRLGRRRDRRTSCRT